MYRVQPPCSFGDPVKEIQTPALLVYLDILEENLAKLATVMKEFPGVAFRPHAKTHKSPDIARLQVQSGAVGVCCQTVTEAEAMVLGGVSDVLITNQIVVRKKLRTVAGLARQARLALCVDSEVNIDEISHAALDLGVTLDLVIEVAVGGDRCGVEPGDDVVRLAKKIQAVPNVNFKGLHCYNGESQHVIKEAERRSAALTTVEKTKRAIKALKENGIECNYVTGGGTGTFRNEAASGVFTEIQAHGSYAFMDVDYHTLRDKANKPLTDYKQSLYVLSTVQSVSPGQRAIVDAGIKALSMDSGEPKVVGGNDQVYEIRGDEHGAVKPSGNLQIGDQVWLIPGHCDPTVNMHEWIVGLRDGRVETVWPVSGRGPGI